MIGPTKKLCHLINQSDVSLALVLCPCVLCFTFATNQMQNQSRSPLRYMRFPHSALATEREGGVGEKGGSLSTWQVPYLTHPDLLELDHSIFCPLQSSAYFHIPSVGPVCIPHAS